MWDNGGIIGLGLSVSSSFDREDGAASTTPEEAAQVLLWFGASMLRAGNSAIRTREWIDVLAPKLGFDAVSVSLSLDSLAVSVRSASRCPASR